MSNLNSEKTWFIEVDLNATGELLRRKRLEAGLSQEDLSERFRNALDPASRIAISRWENGWKLPSISHLGFLKMLYGCSLDELVVFSCRLTDGADDDQLGSFFAKWVARYSLSVTVSRRSISPSGLLQYNTRRTVVDSFAGFIMQKTSSSNAGMKQGLIRKRRETMRKIRANIDPKDRVVLVSTKNRQVFYYQPRGTKARYLLFQMNHSYYPAFSYFRDRGRRLEDRGFSITIKELYEFRRYQDGKLTHTLERIPLMIEYVIQESYNEYNESNQPTNALRREHCSKLAS